MLFDLDEDDLLQAAGFQPSRDLGDDDLIRAVDVSGASIRRLTDWGVLVPLDADDRRRGKKRLWPLKAAAVAARVAALMSGGFSLGKAAGVLLAARLERAPATPSAVSHPQEVSELNRLLAVEPEDLVPEPTDRRIRVLDGNFVFDQRHGSAPELVAMIGDSDLVLVEGRNDLRGYKDAGVPIVIGKLHPELAVVPERQRIAETFVNVDLPVRIAYRRALKVLGYVPAPRV